MALRPQERAAGLQRRGCCGLCARGLEEATIMDRGCIERGGATGVVDQLEPLELCPEKTNITFTQPEARTCHRRWRGSPTWWRRWAYWGRTAASARKERRARSQRSPAGAGQPRSPPAAQGPQGHEMPRRLESWACWHRWAVVHSSGRGARWGVWSLTASPNDTSRVPNEREHTGGTPAGRAGWAICTGWNVRPAA